MKWLVSILLVFTLALVSFIIFYVWDSGQNRSFGFGYYGQYNTVRDALEDLPGVSILGCGCNRDITLEEFVFTIRTDEEREVELWFNEADPIRKMSGKKLSLALREKIEQNLHNAENQVLQENKNTFDEGSGLAAKYPGDEGIERDEAVLFADGFESGGLDKWDEDQTEGDKSRCSVTEEPEIAFYGNHACRMTATRGRNNGAGLIKWFGDGYNEIYARFYVKFAEDAGYTHHFVHINGSPDRWGSFGKAGIRPKGDDFFTTGIEPLFDWGRNPPPGKWMFYTYWPEMKVSRDGKYWGNGFYPKSEVIPCGRWICMEIQVKMNTPGKDDGRQSVWQDGKLIGNFTGFNWRTSEKLKANVFWLMNYVTESAFQHTEQYAGQYDMKVNMETHTVWFDQVVVATKYIGPLYSERDD